MTGRRPRVPTRCRRALAGRYVTTMHNCRTPREPSNATKGQCSSTGRIGQGLMRTIQKLSPRTPADAAGKVPRSRGHASTRTIPISGILLTAGGDCSGSSSQWAPRRKSQSEGATNAMIGAGNNRESSLRPAITGPIHPFCRERELSARAVRTSDGARQSWRVRAPRLLKSPTNGRILNCLDRTSCSLTIAQQ